jgi:hypothetical protein
MSQPREKSASWIAHTIEILAAIGVLSAVVIPALMFPAAPSFSDDAGELPAAFDFEAAATGDSAPRVAPYQQPSRPKSAPNVSAEFATEAVRKLKNRFDFAREMVIAQSHVTDADVAELVQFAQMGNVAPTERRSEEQVLWNWVINVSSIDLSGTKVTDVAVEEIAKLHDIEEVNLDGTLVTDEGLKSFAALKRLKVLILNGTQVTDSGLLALGALRNLEILEVCETAVGDAGVAIVANHPNMQALSVARSQVTGKSLEAVGKLTRLVMLDLSDCQIDDQSAAYLAGLRDLNSLYLNNTDVGDAGVRKLTRLRQLTELNLKGTKVESAGLTVIELALPECEIEF